MSRDSRRNWFSFRRRSAVVIEQSPPIEDREFVVDGMIEEAPLPQRFTVPVGIHPESFEVTHPEFSAGYEAEADGYRSDCVGEAVVPPRRNWKQSLRHSLARSRQRSIASSRSLAAAAKRQAVKAFDRAKPWVKQHRWTVISVSLLTAASATTIGSIIWLSRVPDAAECDKINLLSSDSDRLACAQQRAASGKAEDLLAGINLVKDWGKDHPMHLQAASALRQWSDALLVVARERLAESDLDGAIKLAQSIPEGSPLYQQAQEEIGFWQVERNRGQKIYEKVQIALKQQYWDEAAGLIAKLAMVDDPTWQTRLPNIRKQLDDEKKAGIFLKQATEFAKKNPPEKLGEAIALLMPINRQTFVWEKAQKDINQWRDKLFALADGKLAKQDIDGAIALLRTVPNQIDVTDEQRDLMRVVVASEVSGQKQVQEPILNQVWGMMVADQSVNQVGEKSPYYKQAQALRPKLKMQSEDASTLEFAKALANLGQVVPLEMAIAQVQQVDPKRPRRLQAQTLLAEWRKDLQQIEDRPVLKQAELLAKAGTLEQLRSAVNLINRIPKGRSTYMAAQSQKSAWIAQIQTIEDKPILNEARGMAQSGQLSKAIQVANKIRPGRALYAEAQGNIGSWAAELRAIEDRAILARAESLASQGSLTRAIETASQISGSAVAPEARSSISEWTQQREEIRRSAPPPEPAYPESAPTREPIYSEPVPSEPAYVEPAPPPEPAYVEPAPPPEAIVPTEPEPVPPANEPAPPL